MPLLDERMYGVKEISMRLYSRHIYGLLLILLVLVAAIKLLIESF